MKNKKKSVTYIGELPPPYGGVAVKNKQLMTRVFCSDEIRKIDLVECKRNPWMIPVIFIRIAADMVNGNSIILGVGTKRRLKVLMIMQKMFQGIAGLKKTVILVMGGTLHEEARRDKSLRILLSLCKSVWVQGKGMITALEEQGLKNVHYFPTCKPSENALPPSETFGAIKYVFFSRICEEKGVLIIRDTADTLIKKGISFSITFYGSIDPKIQDEFNLLINQYEQLEYKGLFDATNGNVYSELHQYDAMILPTKWIGEGVPGALIESKMAGLTAIVSDWNFNSEVVIDEKEGLIIKDPLAETLAHAMIRLDQDRDLLIKLKHGAFESRKRYDLDYYGTLLLNEIKQYVH